MCSRICNTPLPTDWGWWLKLTGLGLGLFAVVVPRRALELRLPCHVSFVERLA